MTNTEKPNEVCTNELGYASALVSLGYKFIGVSGDDPQNLSFHFEAGEEDLADLGARYFSGELKVPAISFLQSLNRLKGIIRRARRGYREG